MIEDVKKEIKKIFLKIEKLIYGQYYFSITLRNNIEERTRLLWSFFSLRLSKIFCRKLSSECEINFFIYSHEGWRMLAPVLMQILEGLEIKKHKIRVNLLLYNNRASELSHRKRIKSCHIEFNHVSLLRACLYPKNKIVILCSDQAHNLSHRWGVDTVMILRRFGVKAISIQHSSTREDMIRILATFVSDVLLVTGERVFHQLILKYGINTSKLRLVGNPRHDRLFYFNKEVIMNGIIKSWPEHEIDLKTKKIVLLGTSLRLHYDGYINAYDMYAQYVSYIYKSLDYSKIFLIVQPHPADFQNIELYTRCIPKELSLFIFINPPGSIDTYSLLYISDLLITRASTLAEEAILLKKKVIAFDLMADGATRFYEHLKEYGYYKTAYLDVGPPLAECVNEALFKSSKKNYSKIQNIERDFTYIFDGKSSQRAAKEILKELYR